MGNIQDTVNGSVDSTNFDRYGCVWTYLYSISNSDCDRNCFLYSFKSVSQEQPEYHELGRRTILIYDRNVVYSNQLENERGKMICGFRNCPLQ